MIIYRVSEVYVLADHSTILPKRVHINHDKVAVSDPLSLLLLYLVSFGLS